MPRVGGLAVAERDGVEALKNSRGMGGRNFWFSVQTIRDELLAVRRIHMMKNLVGANTIFRCGFVEAFVMIRDHGSWTETKCGVFARIIMPGEGFFGARRVHRKFCFQSDRLVRLQMRQDKMQFASRVHEKVGTGQLR